MQIKFNGENKIVDNGISVADLVMQEGITSLNMVSIQLNNEFIREEEVEKIFIRENDEINLLFFMGGGQ